MRSPDRSRSGSALTERVRDRAALAVEVQQTGAAALGRRLLRYQFRRKIEIEVADIHARR